MTSLARLSTSLVLLTLLGCTSKPVIKVQAQGVLDKHSAEAVSGTVPVAITNTSPREIELLEYHYTVAVDGGQVWSGRHAGELVLSPGLDRHASLPVVLKGTWPKHEPVRCRVHGSLVFIGNGVFDETLVELGYRPSASFEGAVELVPAQSAQAN